MVISLQPSMSYFLGNTAQYSHVKADPEKIKLAEAQYTVMAATFNSVLRQCREKCIYTEYGEGELNTGEASCIDRCVAKYVLTSSIVAQNVQYAMLPDKMPQYRKVQSMVQKET